MSALAHADGPRSAAELAAALGTRVPVSSLYRSLGVLEEAGIVSPHHGVRGVTRYELAEWLTGHHHHLVCIECGLVEDVEVPGGREAPVLDLVDDLATRSGFPAIDHALEIEGRCARCA